MLANFFDGLTDLVYIADLETHDLLYANAACRQRFRIADLAGKKCHKVFHGSDTPCESCERQPARHREQVYLPHLNAHFKIYEAIAPWHGSKARLIIARETTPQVRARQILRRERGVESLIGHCSHLLAEDSGSPHTLILQVLEEIGLFLEADRCTTFEIRKQQASNTHEWMREDISQIRDSQLDLPESAYADWLPRLRKGEILQLDGVRLGVGQHPGDGMHLRDIASFLIAPLVVSGRLTGFLEVENPTGSRVEEARTALAAISKFMAATIERFHLLTTLEQHSRHDPLTGLGNRHAFQHDVQHISVPGGAVAILEVNGLKKINDVHGIQHGDEMLIRLAGLLADMETGAHPYRLNGGEFALLWNYVGKDVFHETLRRMQVILSGTLDFSAAVGGYRLTDGEAPMTAYTRAEAEMFANKKAFYRHRESDRYRPEGDHILELARPGVLERMLAAGNFLTYWQPKFKVADRSLCGVEVLIRLQKDGRIVPPDQFIPLLESLHRCHVLDFFVFEEACRHLRAWIDEGRAVVPVATNFSRHTFVMPDFLEQLERIRTRYAIPLELLQVEITESADSREHASVQEMSRRLARSGYHLAIDDFGVAHANLATLAEVDFSVLKLDKRLISALEDNPRLPKLLHMLILASHTLSITTVAEGVERDRQLDILAGLGCQEVQGYLLAHPQPVEEFQQRLSLTAPAEASPKGD